MTGERFEPDAIPETGEPECPRSPSGEHDYDRLLIGGGVACTICDEVEPGSDGRYPAMDPPRRPPASPQRTSRSYLPMDCPRCTRRRLLALVVDGGPRMFVRSIECEKCGSTWPDDDETA